MIETNGSAAAEVMDPAALGALESAAAPAVEPKQDWDAAAKDRSDPAGPRHNVVREKVRIRFRKFGSLRFIGHNDLLRCVHRLLRRTGLRVRHSQGFHPMPRVSSPLALPLGVIGCDEILEVEFEDDLPLEDIRQKLIEQAVPGLDFVSLDRLPVSTRTEVVAVEYACELPADWPVAAVQSAIDAFLAAPAWPVVRTTPGKPDRQVDLRQWVRDVSVVEGRLTAQVAVLNGTTARPEEWLAAIGLDRLTADGAVLSRTRVQLKSE